MGEMKERIGQVIGAVQEKLNIKTFAVLGSVAVLGTFGAYNAFADSSEDAKDKSDKVEFNSMDLMMTQGEESNGLSASCEGLPKDKFLTESEDGSVNSSQEAAEYSQSLFDSKTTNKASLSAMESAVTELATSGKTVNNSYSYTAQFDQSMNSLSPLNIDERTNLTRTVLGETAKYEADAIGEGEQMTALVPVYEKTDGECAIDHMKLVHVTATESIPALTYKLRGPTTIEGVNGEDVNLKAFAEVALPGDGSVYVTGWLPTPKPTKGGDKEGTKNEGKAGNKNDKTKGKAGRNAVQPNGGNQGGGSTTHGPSPEKNQGPNNGTATGPNQGPNHGAQPGPESTPNGGTGSGTGPTPGPTNPGPTNPGPTGETPQPTPTCEDTGTCGGTTPNPGKPVDPGLN